MPNSFIPSTAKSIKSTFFMPHLFNVIYLVVN